MSDLSANRLVVRVSTLAATGERGIAPYVTAGDGGLETTLAVLRALEDCGAAGVELGIPFSDPIADGPVLQAAAGRSLQEKVRFQDILVMLRRFRDGDDGAPPGTMPVAIMSYTNPLLRRGWDTTCALVAAAGGDALIVPDLSLEESGPVRVAALAHGLCPIQFAAPSSSDARIAAAAQATRGFLYVVGRFGVTSGSTEFDAETHAFLARVRRLAGVPLAVGFGIREAPHVEAATQHAEIAIVGSALVEHLHQAIEHADDRPAAAAEAARAFLSQLQAGLVA